ncbi:YaiO family outer membrane beta-barrel protein [Pedobacter chinensis]|uniref:YaiO family outer membrane beta-barrel protein n=1 Tax=Pedobacter chinensis TaxID=2282421 RepID=A0A369Q351_9SPHI|nr:YaiO family outer membrane beta-barrel protein [Pedobacter chinensis]RDC57885.1 YaiO family outer membrane beta-barrel protein [Pedobacter chinensis]
MNKGNYNMCCSKFSKTGLILLMCLFIKVSFAQNVSSDDLLKQAVRETNVNKNYPKAIQLAKRGLAISPGYLDIRLLLGRLYLLTNRNTQAEVELNKVLSLKPNQKDALNYLVNLSYQQKNLAKSIGYANQYLKYFATDKAMEIKRVAMLYELTDYSSGDMAWRNLSKKYPNDGAIKNLYIDAHLAAGQNYRKQNELNKAIEEYEKVLALQPDHLECLETLYNLNIQAGNNEQALIYSSLLEHSGDMNITMSKADLLRTMKRYDQAQAIAENLRKNNPNNQKAEVLYKDILYSKAKDQLQKKDSLNAYRSYQKILTFYPADTFSRNQLINLSLANGERNNAIKYINEGIQYYDDPQSIQLKKLSITQNQGDKSMAYQLSKSLLNKYPQNESIRSINHDLFILTRQNRIGLSYGITAFDQQGRKPWNLYSAYYMRTEKGGSLIARVNYADRNDARGYQFEVESYPIHNTGYSYINLAYSNAIIFPKFKFAYSYFLPFNQSWEAEMGVRFLNSYLNYYSVTAGLGKYFGNFWLNGKTFVMPNGKQIANSYILSGRYFINDSTDDYFTAIAGYGFSPDDRGRNFEIKERLNLESIRFTLGYQRTLWKRNILGIFGTWNNQEYIPGKKRNEFDAQISFQHKF